MVHFLVFVTLAYISYVYAAPSKNESDAFSHSLRGHVYRHLGGGGGADYSPVANKFPNQYPIERYKNLPSIFLIGSQKCGTASLIQLLIEHPKLCIGHKKETHFFTHRNFDEDGKLMDQKLFEAYSNLYADPKKSVKKCYNGQGLYIDGTPDMHVCGAVFRIAMLYPPALRSKLKFMAILREPVARDWSWFKFGLTHTNHFGHYGEPIAKVSGYDVDSFYLTKKHAAYFKDGTTLCDLGDAEDLSNLFRGKYIDQLEEFTKYFRRDQILVLNAEAAFKNTTEAMDAVQQFLGLETGWSGAKMPWENHPEELKVKVPPLKCKDRDALGSHYEKYNKRLYKWLDTKDKPPMEPKFTPFPSVENVPCVD